MNLRRLLCLSGMILALGGGLFFLQSHTALAQVDNAAFAEVGEAAQLGNADPRIIAARVINIFLGTLGTILLCLVLYAGFLWMTAGGDAEKVEKAQKTIRNAIIGLIIIVCSWGFVTFILNKLMDATGGGGQIASTSDGGSLGGELGAAGGSLGFQVRSIMPSGPVRIRNVEVRFLFTRDIMPSTATSSITVVRASDNQVVEGALSISEGLVTFVPSAACPAPNAGRKCFAQDTEYIAKVARSLRSRSGLTIACGQNVPACEVRFKTGNLVDVNPPVSSITTPLDGQGIPLGDSVRVTVRSSDDGGISLTDVFVDGRRIGRDATTASTTPTLHDATVVWDTRGATTGTHRIEAHVWDIDSNSVTTTAVTVAVRPRSYFNGVQDTGVPEVGCGGAGQRACVGGACTSGAGCLSGLCEGGLCRAAPVGAEVGCGRPGQPACIGGACTSGGGCLSGLCEGGVCRARGETGVDCGGLGGGGCVGAVCSRGVDCAGGICLSGRCVEQPIIGSFSPTDGRPGTYVTITGANFGTTTGRVLFAGRPATAPAACAAGSSFWSPTQIIVAVPEGATTSSLQVFHGTNGMSDVSNDERGPRLTDFRVNGIARPGLCAIRPGSGTVGDRARLSLAGVNLGNTTGRLYFNDQDVSVTAWRPTAVDLTAPLVPPGGYAVRARVGDLESNPVSFSFADRVITSPPAIDQLRPTTGTVGSYVTLLGRNFGSAGKVFFRNPVTNALGEADVRFPAQCGSNFWSDAAVMIKVPAILRGGLGEEQPVRAGRYEIYVQRDGITQSNRVAFTVIDGAPGPGICAIQPIAGPIGTGVTILGERFGSSVGAVTFAGATSTSPRPAGILGSESWREGEIRTRVPAGAGSGAVRVAVGGQVSNDAFFSVASCLTSPGICGPSLACCPDGSCAVGGVCAALGATTSTFAWRTSTGRLYQTPRVVEECTNEDPPSPSPRSLSTCVNAQAVVRFNMHIERATVNTTNVLVRRCTGVTGDPCSSGTPERVEGAINFFTGSVQDHFVFTPTGGVWAPNATYQIILTTGIRSTSADGSRAMLENAEQYGRGNAYAYRFRTREGSDLCAARSVSVSPSTYVMDQLGLSKDDYTVSPRAEDMCVQLNPDTMGWNWSVSDAGRASVVPNNSSQSSSSTVTGLGATDRDPVLIVAELARPTPPVPVRGSGQLTVRLTPPRVISYAPNCNDACVNAAVWARFNVSMDRVSLTRTIAGRRQPNIQIKRCTNEACREFDRTLDLSEAIIDILTPPGTFATDTMMKLEATTPARDPATGETIRVSQLEPGKFYIATILGGLDGLRSTYGRLPLTGLNSSDPVGFSWKFRIKTGNDAYCSAARVDVAPSEKYEAMFGMRQLFIANPISAPDTCSRDGQMLVSERSTSWTTSDARVADFVRLGALRESVSLADRLPEFCTSQCLNAGSNGVFGRTAVCGNRTVETTDVNYCHRRSDPTRACAVGDLDCVTRFAENCSLLPAGAQEAEECDNGESNGVAGECSSSCLWNPVRRLTDSPAGTCGNGSIQRGEQCDTGRVCVGGATPGQECTSAPGSCGVGGSCQVVERRGCSDRCQALGSQAGGATCGNGDLSDGETCDYTSSGRAPGCTAQCLHAGSSSAERRLCGNGRIEPGESCEMQTPGRADSQYCRMVGGALRCYAGTRFSALCDVNTCLNQGTNRCQRVSDAECCGNSRMEAGEECDGQPGCTARCLLSGSSPAHPDPSLCGDRVVGTGEQCEAPAVARETGAEGLRSEITNRQLFEIVGLREPTPAELTGNNGRMSSNIGATYQGRNGTAIYGVQCNYQREAECRAPGTGLTSGGCCAVRPRATPYPRAGATDVCRNVLISAEFNQLMNEGSVRGNFLISSQSTTEACPTGTTRLDAARPTAFNWSTPLRSIVARIKALFLPASAADGPWCVGTAKGTVVFETNEEAGRTTAAFLLDEALQGNTEYQVILLGDPAIRDATVSSTRRGLRGANGIYADGNITWRFTTGERVCTIDELRLNDTNVEHPTVFYKSREAHRYVGRAVSFHREEVVPLSPIPGLYSWIWRDWVSSRPNILTVAGSPSTPQIAIATTTAQNLRGTSLIATGVTITADRVKTPSTVGTTQSTSLLSTVILCDNPWVPPGNLPGRPPRFEDSDYHFATMYCLDAKTPGPSDDLPELLVNRLDDNPSDVARGVKRQYIFSFSRPAFRSDAIGLRVMANPLHLSPKDWYQSQGFAGTPQSATVDGYEAIRDGSTLYIASTNVNLLEGNLSTDIYVLSHNPDAQVETRQIFEQLVDNFTFNTNLLRDADNVCRTQTGDVFRRSGTNQIVNCTADWECVRYDSRGYCASAKDKLQRDLKRIADLQYMAAELEGAKRRDGQYPQLSGGTFLQTFVTSRWPSWQSVLATAVGKPLPEDPLNVHVSCGQCLSSRQACMEDSDCGGNNDRCVAVEGFDPSTCWNAVNSTYRCPVLEPSNPRSVSRLYQYRSVDRGSRYELGTELEYLPIEQYTPSILPETRRCVSEGASDGRVCRQDSDCVNLGPDRRTVLSTGTCTPQGGQLRFGNVCTGRAMGLGGICGDGIVGTGERCEPGQTQRTVCAVGGIENTGRRQQICRSDCSGYVDQPGAACQPNVVCGNGRIETGETCDDGALNGTYGHCNRTCNGFASVCGDEQLSAGETCDLGTNNGNYCDTRDAGGARCVLGNTCGTDCRSLAPHCGDGVVQTQSIGDGGPVEQCDSNNPETTTSAVCSAGRIGEACDPTNQGRDCALGPISGSDLCARNAADRSCTGIKVGQCAGGLRDRADCTCPQGQDSCTSGVCGTTYRCIMYPTRRTRTCTMPAGEPVANQCKWTAWSACRPANFCGDGVLDTGEVCDDANRNDNDACTNRCQANVCGDAIIQTGAEECDFGTNNGRGCDTAEYGATCAACTNQCRMTASSGGFCGNNELDGAEQCDGADFGRAGGVQDASALTCSGLGFDFAERVRCTDVADPARTEQIEVAAAEAVARCDQSRPIRDIITCGRMCGFAGCQTCAATGGTGSITAVVRDAVYPDRVVAGATVTLLQNGRRITTQTTNEQGQFTFTGLNSNAACGGYRIYVEFTRDNPATTDNEALNGGYWMYESNLFSPPTFERQGIQSSDRPGKVFLLPKVSRDETLVVHAWYGNLQNNDQRYLLSHLILPPSRAYRFNRGARTWNQDDRCSALRVPGWVDGQPCYRDIRENGGDLAGSEAQGNPNLAEYPHARLFCSSGAAGVCYQVANSPQATRYRWSIGAIRPPGNFSYFLVDQRSAVGRGMSPSHEYYRQTSSTVWIVTQSRVYKVQPPTQSSPRCQGKFWLVFQQQASDGVIDVKNDPAQALLCGNDPIPGETSERRNLPGPAWPGDESTSWMAFGRWDTGPTADSINWDVAPIGPAAR
ncbi:IPT/TIG domain-containing protein [Patescibacteria group bacterium]|nr:IPT/TIG domain-containing protein [Patescibacteria group bacterium]